jgi:hypothetical protein
MSLNKEKQYTFKIHCSLLNEIKRAVQFSIENEIKKRENCICSDNNVCKCISKYLEKNFDPNQINSISKSLKRNLKDLDLKMVGFNPEFLLLYCLVDFSLIELFS